MTIEIPDEMMELIARRAAEIVAAGGFSAQRVKPYTVSEFARAVQLSEASVYRMLEAGELRRVPGVGKKLIPAGELERFR